MDDDTAPAHWPRSVLVRKRVAWDPSKPGRVPQTCGAIIGGKTSGDNVRAWKAHAALIRDLALAAPEHREEWLACNREPIERASGNLWEWLRNECQN